MSNVRIGVVGLGNIGTHHATYLAEDKIKDARLTAVYSSSPEKAARFADVRCFSNPHDLLHSSEIDAVIIATPHYQHTSLGIAAFEQALHVMVEKPISAHKADAERLVAASKTDPSRVFAAMFQFRAEPRYVEIRRILEHGGIGRLLRTTWIMTDWYRTEAYYASGGWRATWQGEGGGVLLNQCLHNLDTLQWLTGMPSRVRGFCMLGKHHAIEVEDEATAYFDYPNGASGVIITSTGESPGSNRLELAGTNGRLLLEGDRLLFTKNAMNTDEFSRQAKLGFARPESYTQEIPMTAITNTHAILTQNFVNAILRGEPLIAHGAEGLKSVELANAILYSSLKEEIVELPLDGAAYERKLQELTASSAKQAKCVIPIKNENVADSFKK